MPNSKEIKSRIKSIKNTKKITKAMELVAASKMKRAVASTISSRVYAKYSYEILTSIAKNIDELKHPLFTEREVKKVLMVLITSNRGLCGAYNAQAIKKSINLIKNTHTDMDVVAIGKKGDMAIRKLGLNVIASFNDINTDIPLAQILPISKFIIDEFVLMKYDKVMVVYTDFISALVQKANVKQILPINKIELKDYLDSIGGDTKKEEIKKEQVVDYLFEGDKIQLIESLAFKLTRTEIYQMILESNASEQSSRMLAMKNASEASGDMISDLTLVFNKQRQSNITREISEISAGMTSMS